MDATEEGKNGLEDLGMEIRFYQFAGTVPE
jgi:hypothetical protein